jgi:hypothetical protein
MLLSMQKCFEPMLQRAASFQQTLRIYSKESILQHPPHFPAKSRAGRGKPSGGKGVLHRRFSTIVIDNCRVTADNWRASFTVVSRFVRFCGVDV